MSPWRTVTFAPTVALRRLNGLPFNSTGETIQNDGLWKVYEFTRQMDAILFSDRFKGRWLRGKEFHYPERPANLPALKRSRTGRSSIRATRGDRSRDDDVQSLLCRPLDYADLGPELSLAAVIAASESA
jgi:hypothetical protein